MKQTTKLPRINPILINKQNKHTYNITGDSVFTKHSRYFTKFHQIFNDDWIPSVHARASDQTIHLYKLHLYK